jgi:hypothetical protein
MGLATIVAGFACSVAPPIASQAHSEARPLTLVAMRRLTEAQYRSAVADVFGPDLKVSGRFEPERREDGLLSIGNAHAAISPTGLQQYLAMAEQIASQAVQDQRAGRAPCRPTSYQDRDCFRKYLADDGYRLFRRPLTPGQLEPRLEIALREAARTQDPKKGLRAGLTSLLVAPEFLFRMEYAVADRRQPQRLRLDDYSAASRLSFAAWNAPPDEELLDAARTGRLRNPAAREAQIDRLLSSPRLEAGVRAFFADLLQLDDLRRVTKDPARYPAFGDAAAQSAREEPLRLVTDLLLRQEADYRDVFTTRKTFINRTLASIYRVPITGSEEWQPYEFAQDSGRAGLLSQVAFSATFSHPGRTSPTKRGVAISEAFLCEKIEPPPPNVDQTSVTAPKDPMMTTARGRLLVHASDESCQSCHQTIDPVGLALERFDGIGRARQVDDGKPIDLHVKLGPTEVLGADGLGFWLHNDPRPPACLVEKFFAYGAGRTPRGAEKTALKPLTAAFAQQGFKVRPLLRAMLSSSQFYAVAPPEAVKVANGSPQAAAGGL